MGQSRPLLFIFVLFLLQFQYKLKKVQMVCLGFEPGAAGWQAQTKPRSYGGHPASRKYLLRRDFLCDGALLASLSPQSPLTSVKTITFFNYNKNSIGGQLSYISSETQCGQVRQFLKALGNKFYYESCQIFSYFEYFWVERLEKIGLLFIPTSGHTKFLSYTFIDLVICTLL